MPGCPWAISSDCPIIPASSAVPAPARGRAGREGSAHTRGQSRDNPALRARDGESGREYDRRDLPLAAFSSLTHRRSAAGATGASATGGDRLLQRFAMQLSAHGFYLVLSRTAFRSRSELRCPRLHTRAASRNVVQQRRYRHRCAPSDAGVVATSAPTRSAYRDMRHTPNMLRPA
jgi:hypothetical protein